MLREAATEQTVAVFLLCKIQNREVKNMHRFEERMNRPVQAFLIYDRKEEKKVVAAAMTYLRARGLMAESINAEFLHLGLIVPDGGRVFALKKYTGVKKFLKHLLDYDEIKFIDGEKILAMVGSDDPLTDVLAPVRQDDVSDPELASLRQNAELLGIRVRPNWGKDRIAAEIRNAQRINQSMNTGGMGGPVESLDDLFDDVSVHPDEAPEDVDEVGVAEASDEGADDDGDTEVSGGDDVRTEAESGGGPVIDGKATAVDNETPPPPPADKPKTKRRTTTKKRAPAAADA